MSYPEIKLREQFQALLLNSKPDSFKSFKRHLKEAKTTLSGVQLAKCQVLERATNVLEAVQVGGEYGKCDVAIMLRQVNRLFEQNLAISSVFWQWLKPIARKMSLQVHSSGNNNQILLIAKPWLPNWLNGDTRAIDVLESRRFTTSVLADGNLYSMVTYRTYRSNAQRTAVNTAMYAPPGSTTLITLPTGEGKSMCILLPAWVESNAGRRDNGTTIVVVPTISLAQDQTESAKQWFRKATMPPAALTGFTTPEHKKLLYKGVREGSLPILYTSPEALLMNSWLYDACQHSASIGKLTRFVVDEAHLVDTWGAEFRPEFQLLGAFCTQLRQRTGGQLVTLLLSATVSYETEVILQKIFVPDGKLQTVIGNRLRPEPSYWFSHTKERQEQEYRILDALNHLPRPAILYVTMKKDAKEWQALLKKKGYERVRVYTGDTRGEERRRILKEWRNNQIDIIIGNSAFGVGVDKPDIRTIIHATVPDNMDRYYQEVGRGGRDGNSSISLVVTKSQDIKESKRRKSKLIGEEIGWMRWQSMWNKREGISGTEFILSMTVPPIDRRAMGNSTKNRQWNQRMLLLLQRCGLLAITDSTPIKRQEIENNLTFGNETELFVQVVIKDKKTLLNEELFKEALNKQRRKELDAADRQIESFAKMAIQSASDQPNQCIGHKLKTLYPYTTYLCGGCPACRHNQDKPYLDKPIWLNLELDPWANKWKLSDKLKSILGVRDVALVLCQNSSPEGTFGPLIPLLVENGIEQFVVEATTVADKKESLDKMFKDLSQPTLKYRKHRIIPTTPLFDNRDELFALPTAIIYPQNNNSIDKLFHFIVDEMSQFNAELPIMHIIPFAAELPSRGGLMNDKVNGTRIFATDLLNQLLVKQTQKTFR